MNHMNFADLTDAGNVTFDVIRNVMVPMRDGTRLATDLYLPATDHPVPVIVERTGYNKDKSPIHWTKSAEYFAARGYAVAIQDCRGIHASEGEYYPWRDDGWGERQDGYDTIEWLAEQDWCSGNVGMFGGSYAGATQLRAAIAAPPHLKALVVRQAPNNPLLSVRPNGVWQMTGGGGWITDQALEALRQAERRLQGLQARDSDEFFQAFPQERFGDQLRWVREWLAHDSNTDYWKDFDCVPRAGRIEVPAIHIGSWYDVHRRSTVAMHAATVEHSPAAADQRLIMGPWIHGSRFHTDDSGRHVGEVDMGADAKLDLNALSLRWFDHWLRDSDNGITDALPPVSYFLMGERTWHESETWPPPNTDALTFYTDDDKLTTNTPPTTSARSFVDKRSDPARTTGGDAVLFEWGSEKASATDPGAQASASRTLQRGPRDQRAEEHKGVTFTAEALDSELRLTGHVEATVYVSLAGEDRPEDACLIARLTQVYPDGRSIDIVDGSCRWRDVSSQPTPVTIDLGDTAVAIPAGHQLRLAIYASNFPRVPLRAEHDLDVTVHCGGATPTGIQVWVSPAP